ncbi:hypothetical protein GCM10012280_48840 [Wenjunlia tyrosinilytica]|uniref:Uncharacterized protein n=1 Tax=Wenjunlia tyrosinilytica TaxID=1544741 RepID=A0A917ZU73_9ACTN|nr:hypothetical protein GCM10012280_48840 [Wenjunlia tyrosinilytica]
MTNCELVPPGAVTVTWTMPVPAGEIATICVSELTMNEGAGVAPKRTLVAPLNAVPVTVTGVAPTGGPEVGETEVTLGGATSCGCRAESVGELAEWFTATSFGGCAPGRPRGKGRCRDSSEGRGGS